jgi:pyridoxamine 5'-phosphate oxidase
VITGRAELDERLASFEERFEGEEVPRPPHWGGYLVVPDTIEFWQGREFRLHDRFRYTREPGGWRLERLAP